MRTSYPGLTSVLLFENEALGQIANDTPFYRFCSDAELECVCNGGVSGKFWLNAPYYGNKPYTYMKTTYGSLNTSHKAAYGDDFQQVMTADGTLYGATNLEIVDITATGERVSSPAKYAWTNPPFEMSVSRELPDGSPLEWEDNFERPQIKIRFGRFDKFNQFIVMKIQGGEGIVIQRFDTLENASKFCYKVLREKFDIRS